MFLSEETLSQSVFLYCERDLSLYLLSSLISVFRVISCGIVNALVDFNAKNLGAAVGGAFFALKIIYC